VARLGHHTKHDELLRGHGVGQVSVRIDITSAVWQLATRCLILGGGFSSWTYPMKTLPLSELLHAGDCQVVVVVVVEVFYT